MWADKVRLSVTLAN
jgi:hypothetical protein